MKALDAEIKATIVFERDAVRYFLLYATNGGQSGNTDFDKLKYAPENVV